MQRSASPSGGSQFGSVLILLFYFIYLCIVTPRVLVIPSKYGASTNTSYGNGYLFILSISLLEKPGFPSGPILPTLTRNVTVCHDVLYEEVCGEIKNLGHSICLSVLVY